MVGFSVFLAEGFVPRGLPTNEVWEPCREDLPEPRSVKRPRCEPAPLPRPVRTARLAGQTTLRQLARLLRDPDRHYRRVASEHLNRMFVYARRKSTRILDCAGLWPGILGNVGLMVKYDPDPGVQRWATVTTGTIQSYIDSMPGVLRWPDLPRSHLLESVLEGRNREWALELETALDTGDLMTSLEVLCQLSTCATQPTEPDPSPFRRAQRHLRRLMMPLLLGAIHRYPQQMAELDLCYPGVANGAAIRADDLDVDPPDLLLMLLAAEPDPTPRAAASRLLQKVMTALHHHDWPLSDVLYDEILRHRELPPDRKFRSGARNDVMDKLVHAFRGCLRRISTVDPIETMVRSYRVSEWEGCTRLEMISRPIERGLRLELVARLHELMTRPGLCRQLQHGVRRLFMVFRHTDPAPEVRSAATLSSVAFGVVSGSRPLELDAQARDAAWAVQLRATLAGRDPNQCRRAVHWIIELALPDPQSVPETYLGTAGILAPLVAQALLDHSVVFFELTYLVLDRMSSVPLTYAEVMALLRAPSMFVPLREPILELAIQRMGSLALTEPDHTEIRRAIASYPRSGGVGLSIEPAPVLAIERPDPTQFRGVIFDYPGQYTLSAGGLGIEWTPVLALEPPDPLDVATHDEQDLDHQDADQHDDHDDQESDDEQEEDERADEDDQHRARLACERARSYLQQYPFKPSPWLQEHLGSFAGTEPERMASAIAEQPPLVPADAPQRCRRARLSRRSELAEAATRLLLRNTYGTPHGLRLLEVLLTRPAADWPGTQVFPGENPWLSEYDSSIYRLASLIAARTSAIPPLRAIEMRDAAQQSGHHPLLLAALGGHCV